MAKIATQKKFKQLKVAPTGPPGPLLPMLSTVQEVYDRLNVIFPLGSKFRPNVVCQAGARTVFVALYTGATTASHRWISPKHIVWMGDTQAADLSSNARLSYSIRPVALADRWYKENSRELRDSVISKALLPCGAFQERPGLAVNSSIPRYSMALDFASLFDPELIVEAVAADAEAWRVAHLTDLALMRIDMARKTLNAASARVRVNFPAGGGIVLPEGPSPAIIKAVVEEFGPRFLVNPQVLWISDSRVKNAYRNEHLESSLRIIIDPKKTLPDLIMVDMDPPGRLGRVLVVFVEAVASDGPVDDLRQQALIDVFAAAGMDPADYAFVTAYLDKTSSTYRASAHELAWKSFAWFVSEPDCLIHMREANIMAKLATLL